MPTGLTLVKKFNYRGDPTEEFSNTYWFTGSTPADATAWQTLATALWTVEKTVFSNNVSLVAYYGYDDDSDDRHAVWSADLHAAALPGTFTVPASVLTPGDCAAWVRWQTGRLTSKGKKIYLRKYYHGVYCVNLGTGSDAIIPEQKGAYTALGTKLRDGSFADARTITGRGHTDTISSSSCSQFATTRTLKRRGKRPGS